MPPSLPLAQTVSGLLKGWMRLEVCVPHCDAIALTHTNTVDWLCW